MLPCGGQSPELFPGGAGAAHHPAGGEPPDQHPGGGAGSQTVSPHQQKRAADPGGAPVWPVRPGNSEADGYLPGANAPVAGGTAPADGPGVPQLSGAAGAAACADGVGTKIIPLIKKRDTKTIANDLFAMNINDLVCCGAKPLFFLDYIALNRLDVDLVSNLIGELNKVLEKYSCALLGGETSELGDLILKNNFDISGFLVGAVKKDKLIDKNNVKKGDMVIALESSGAHSNGFSLIRKLYKDGLLSDDLFEKSLAPVRIYYDTVQKLNDKKLVKSCANITGGGILANLERSIPKGLGLKADYGKIKLTPLFKRLLFVFSNASSFFL